LEAYPKNKTAAADDDDKSITVAWETIMMMIMSLRETKIDFTLKIQLFATTITVT
jgi:hypothetical protein